MQLLRQVGGVWARSIVLVGVTALLVGCGSDLFTTGTTVGTHPEPDSCSAEPVVTQTKPKPAANVTGPAFTGVVKAGTLPVAGASVMIYAAGTNGNGSGATPLLGAFVPTNSNGVFAVQAGFACPSSNTVVYALAIGGEAVPAAGDESSTQLAAVLGTCGSVPGGASFTVNEATTVAAAYAMAQFFSVNPISLAATATNGGGISLAAATAENLVDPATGLAPGSGFPATGTAPVEKINSLANLLHACVVSSGGGSSACQQLFTAAYGPAGKGPQETSGETFGAAISLAKNAGENVAELYELSEASAAYGPVLGTAPDDWTLLVNYGGGGMDSPSAVSIDSNGRVWVANYFAVASLFTNTGEPVFPNGITGDHLENSYGGAVYVDDSFWVANEESGSDFNEGLGSISVLSSTGVLDGHYLTGGINFPLAVAFDTSGMAWVVDYGDSSVTLLDGSGNPRSGVDGYSSASLQFPVAVATDAKCNAYVANQSSDTLTLVTADGSSFTDFTVGEGPSGVAIDAGGNVWSANYYGNSVGLVTTDGSVASGDGFTGGGLDHPQGIAADGVGNIWVANYREAGLTELAGATASAPGAVLSPSMGWAADSGNTEAFGLAIDAGGNIWVTDFASNTLSEYVGMAAPVQTPLVGPVQVP